MTTKHTIIRWHGFGACMVCGKMNHDNQPIHRTGALSRRNDELDKI